MLNIELLSAILKLLKNSVNVFRKLNIQILNNLILTLIYNRRNQFIFIKND